MSPMNHSSLRTQVFVFFFFNLCVSDTRNVNMFLFPLLSCLSEFCILRSQFTVFGLKRQERGLIYLELLQSLSKAGV